MSKARRLAITLMSVLFALTFMLGLVACGGGQSAKDAINAYLLPQDNTLVDNDFTLPKKIGINDGVKVKWKSDNAAITIEEGTADAYDAKVTLQDTVTSVTLTISSGKASKDFTVRVDELNVFTFMKRYGNDDYDSESFPQRKTAQKEDFALDSSYTVQGKTAKITWASKDTEYLEVITNADGTQTAHPKPGDDLVKVKLTATFAYGEGNPTPTASKDYEISVSPDLDHRQLVNKLYSEAGFPIEFEGYVVHVYEAKNSEQYGPMASFYAVDSDFCSGYYIWQAALESAEDVAKVKPGAHFTFSGDIAKNYNGLWESNGYEDGTAVFDDAEPIDINEHIRAFDNEAIAATDSARWQMSRLVSLSGWKVSGEPEEPDAKGNVSFALTYGDRTLYVYTSTYVTTDDDAMTALKAKFATLHDGTFINITGILGYNNSKGEFNPKSFRIQPRTADDITVVEAQGTNDGAKLKAAYAAVQAAVEENFSGLITTAKENVQMPTADIAGAEGVTVSYRLAKKVVEGAPVVVGTDGKISVTPQAKDKTCLIEVNYTIGGKVVAQSVFTIRSWQATDQDIVDEVASALNNSRIDTITSAGEYDLPKVETFGATVTWQLGKEDAPAPEWAHIEGTKLVIDYLPMQDTALKLYAKVTLNNTTSDEIFFNVKVTAMPNKTFSAIEEAEAGDYVYAAMHKGVRLYASSLELDGKYIGTTSDPNEAVKLTIEQKKGSTTEWYLKMGKKYLEVNPYENKGKVSYNLRLVDEPSKETLEEGSDATPREAVWEWDDTIKIFKQKPLATEDLGTLTPADAYFYIGMRDPAAGDPDYTTMSPSDIKFITGSNAVNLDVTQHPSRFGTLVEATDETRANEVLNSLTLTQTSFSETTGDEGIALPTSKQYNATVVWSVKDQTSLVSIEDNVLTISSLPTADTEVTLKVTVTVNEEIVSKDVTITIKPTYTFVGAGTAENPYTVEDAIALVQALADGTYYQGNTRLYFKGYVTDIGGANINNGTHVGLKNVKISSTKGGSVTMQLSQLYWDNELMTDPNDQAVNPLHVGDYVEVGGFLEKFNGMAALYASQDKSQHPQLSKWTKAELTDEDKANDVLNAITFTTLEFYSNTEDVVLPTTSTLATQYGATIAWKLENENNLTLTENTLHYQTAPAGPDPVEVKLTVTVTIGTDTTVSKFFTITVYPEGTVEQGTESNPFTVADVRAMQLASGNYYGDGKKVYIEGYVTDVGKVGNYGLSNVKIADTAGSSDTVLVYSINWGGVMDPQPRPSESPLKVGDKVVILGFIKNHNGTIQITYKTGATDPSGTNPIITEFVGAKLTEAEMQAAIDAELAKVTGVSITAPEDKDLPTSEDENVIFSWALKADNTFPDGIQLAEGKITVTALPAEGKTVTLVLTATYKDSKPAVSKTQEVTVTISAAPQSDDEKAQAALDSLDYDSFKGAEYSEVNAEGVQLPQTSDTVTKYSATVTWTVEGEPNEYVSISENKLCINKLPEGADQTITLKVTVSVNNTSKTDTITITVKKAPDPNHKEGTYTITADSITDFSNSYKSYEWKATDSNGELKGKLFAYSDSGNMQFNQTKDGYAVVNTVATPGPITSIKVTAVSGKEGNWKLFTNAVPYSELDKTPKAGTDQGAKNVVSATTGTTWTVSDANAYYFTLVVDATGAKQLKSIEITYAGTPMSDELKATAALNAITFEETELKEDVTLPTSVLAGVTFTWTTEDGGEAAKVENNTTLKIVRQETDVDFTLKVTATSGEHTTEARSISLKVVAKPAEGVKESKLLYTLTANVNSTGNTNYTTSGTEEVDGITWSVNGNVKESGGWRFGGKGITGVDRKLSAKTALTGTVKQIIITFGNISITVNSATLKAYNTDPTTGSPSPVATKTFTCTANNSVTIDIDSDDWTDRYYEFVFNVTNSGTSSNKFVAIKSIVFNGYAAE